MALLPLIPALPLLGFLVLALAGRALPRPAAAAVGAGSVGLSLAAALALAVRAGAFRPGWPGLSVPLWRWLQSGPLRVEVGLFLDALSLTMVLVVTGVGFLIHLYSLRFMAGDEGFARFFAFMNLFVAAMLLLVLADHLLLLFLGWEGVGLCSYLLIGFWYRDPANVRAANKAFLVTRVGDIGLLIGLLVLFTGLGTLGIRETLQRAALLWGPGSPAARAGLPAIAAALLLAGAVGKSAQLPLQVWLPDAMAGPTPVSALIHAATMVTAGVYLIARLHVLYELAPAVRLAVALIGAATLLVAGVSAAFQRDVKRALAWSTISQVGYMFLALGVAAWPAAVFHLVTHAFFKSLLFLGAGVVIMALEEEHDLARMGGLWRRLPVAFWTFLTGALSMAAIPPFTAGFYSKEWILRGVYVSRPGGFVLWLAALFGVFLTALYTFRLVFRIFLGPPGREPARRPGALLTVPLVILAVPAAFIGFLEMPRSLGNVQLFFHFIRGALPTPRGAEPGFAPEVLLHVLSELASLLGIGAAYLAARRAWRARPERGREPALSPLGRFWLSGWGFDRLYERLIVRPVLRLARVGREGPGGSAEPSGSVDPGDWIPRSVAAAARLLGRGLPRSQTGRLRDYALVLAAGAAAILALVVLR